MQVEPLLPQPLLWPSVTLPLPIRLLGLPGSSWGCSTSEKSSSFSILPLASPGTALAASKGRWTFDKEGRKPARGWKAVSHIPSWLPAAESWCFRIFPPSLGRGYCGDDLGCGEVQLGWGKKEQGKKSMQKGPVNKWARREWLEENWRLQEVGKTRKNKRLKSRLKCLRKEIGRKGRERKYRRLVWKVCWRSQKNM